MSPTFTPTGHPDFQAVNSTPIGVLVAQEAGLPIGTWGPFTVNVTSGGAYMLALFSAAFGGIGCTDIQVQHIDTAGNVVFTDFFGAVLSSIDTTATFPLKMSGPTIVRGNVYGNQLRISGQCATSAFLNALPGIGSATAAAINMNIYILPNGLGDPDPKVSNGAGLLAAGINLPGAMLATFVNFGIIASSNFSAPCVPYSGPAVLAYRQTGVTTTPTNARIVLAGYSVAGGAATPIWEQNYATAAPVIGYNADVDIPACLLFMQLFNQDAAQASTWNINLTAARTA